MVLCFSSVFGCDFFAGRGDRRKVRRAFRRTDFDGTVATSFEAELTCADSSNGSPKTGSLASFVYTSMDES